MDDIKRIELIETKPGDTMVISCQQFLSKVQRDSMKAWIEDKIAPYHQGVNVIVLDGGMTIDVLRHKDA